MEIASVHFLKPNPSTFRHRRLCIGTTGKLLLGTVMVVSWVRLQPASSVYHPSRRMPTHQNLWPPTCVCENKGSRRCLSCLESRRANLRTFVSQPCGSQVNNTAGTWNATHTSGVTAQKWWYGTARAIRGYKTCPITGYTTYSK